MMFWFVWCMLLINPIWGSVLPSVFWLTYMMSFHMKFGMNIAKIYRFKWTPRTPHLVKNSNCYDFSKLGVEIWNKVKRLLRGSEVHALISYSKRMSFSSKFCEIKVDIWRFKSICNSTQLDKYTRRNEFLKMGQRNWNFQIYQMNSKVQWINWFDLDKKISFSYFSLKVKWNIFHYKLESP